MLRKLACIALVLASTGAQAEQSQWPQGSMRSFMVSCVKYSKQLVAPCRCIYDGITREIAPEDFVKQTNAGTIGQDARYKRITTDCATRAQVRQ